ncbi:MAG: hypothetical protein K2H64_02415 [Desulfovibrio sp.]|nr:hypothetical protein [Desulfovibrio sp.]
MKFRTAVFCNTRDAHRLMKFAYADYDNQIALDLNFALFAAYFTKNLILDDANLLKIAADIGMGEQLAARVLNSDTYRADVIGDEREAR